MEHLPRLANQGLEVGETENAAGVTAAKEFSSGPGLEKLDGHKSNTSYAKASAGDDIIDLVRDTENLTKDDAIARLLELEERHERHFSRGGPGHLFGDLEQAAEGLAIPGEAFLQHHDPLEPAVPFTHEQRAGLQSDALPRLRRAAVEGNGDVLLLPGAKDPSDRFVETAERIGLQSIGQPSHQQPTREMGRRLAAQVGAPLTAQPIEVKALKIGNN
jgi:hypothetical protein